MSSNRKKLSKLNLVYDFFYMSLIIKISFFLLLFLAIFPKEIFAKVLMRSPNFETEFIQPIKKATNTNMRSQYLSTPELTDFKKTGYFTSKNQSLSIIKLENNNWDLSEQKNIHTKNTSFWVSDYGKISLEKINKNSNAINSPLPETFCNPNDKCNAKTPSDWIKDYTGWGFRIADLQDGANLVGENKYNSLRNDGIYTINTKGKTAHLFHLMYIPTKNEKEFQSSHLLLSYEIQNY